MVVAICVLFVNLGFWQLRRLDERQIENLVIASRMTAAAIPIEELIVGAGSDIDSLEFRNADAAGVFRPDLEVLVRSQVHAGTAGWHVLTPLLLSNGEAVLVNRGWVPLEMDSVPVAAEPRDGEVEITGWVHLTRVRATGGRAEPQGQLTQISRVDLARLQEQMPFRLLPVYLVADGGGDDLPIAVPRPETTDEGPHLMYAIEWFSFTLISVVGYFFLLRRAVRGSQVVGSGRWLGQTRDDGDVGEGP
jgi:surfeit locus 1 family protein